MTTGGWINMILSVGFVTTLFSWCIWRILREPEHPGQNLAHIEPIEEDEADKR
jgi:hypothetical protein